MDINNSDDVKDGDLICNQPPAPSQSEVDKSETTLKKKKRRRGKIKRNLQKPYVKVPWQDRRNKDKSKRNNRFRKIVLAKTHAPFNNNQFLMEIHKPEPANNFQILQTPLARTRDSSFSVDSEDNYFYSLPEDEEEYLTKEFSSVYEDAQCERLSNMSKNELIQEYLLLEAKYDNLLKRTEKSRKTIEGEEKKDEGKDNIETDKETFDLSFQSNVNSSISEMMQKLKDHEQQIKDLQLTNENLIVENEQLKQQSHQTSSEDSESDSSSTSGTSSSSSPDSSPDHELVTVNGEDLVDNHNHNGYSVTIENSIPMVNGFNHPDDLPKSPENNET